VAESDTAAETSLAPIAADTPANAPAMGSVDEQPASGSGRHAAAGDRHEEHDPPAPHLDRDDAAQDNGAHSDATGDGGEVAYASSDDVTDVDPTLAELRSVQAAVEAARAQLVELNDAIVLQQVGIYEYHHPLEDAEAHKERLSELQEQLKDTVRQREAVLASHMFSYNNSLAAGRRMVADFSKLMLRAYNAEADTCRRSLRAGNVITAKARLDNTVSTIAKLGAMMEMRINPSYHALRISELELTADYLMKVQEEREAAREERERLREEQKAQSELARQREQLDKQQTHYTATLQTLVEQGRGHSAEASDIRSKIVEVEEAISANETRAANIRIGTVYVISNIGAFGPGIAKIGLTRRLDPMERVRELGDASVPFPFDLHAQFFSEDAVTLEAELHRAFAHRRVNNVNLRREFFFSTPAEVREVMVEKLGNLLKFVEQPEATQYLQSKASWPSNVP
jgi:hypothetical protein